MFPEFGQAPLCLALDLDSYDGLWTHMAAFRGRGGWLMAARATIQDADTLAHTTLVVACDEYDAPIPAWRAAQLATCDWSGLMECAERVPDVLEGLMAAEREAFHARWQRERNAALRALDGRSERRLALIDAEERVAVAQHETAIAALRRDWRQAALAPDRRSHLRIQIELEEAAIDAVAMRAASRRRTLRAAVAREEARLWQTDDVLIEGEPLWCVSWHAAAAPLRQSRSQVRRAVRSSEQMGWGAMAPWRLPSGAPEIRMNHERSAS